LGSKDDHQKLGNTNILNGTARRKGGVTFSGNATNAGPNLCIKERPPVGERAAFKGKWGRHGEHGGGGASGERVCRGVNASGQRVTRNKTKQAKKTNWGDPRSLSVKEQIKRGKRGRLPNKGKGVM